MSQRDKLLEMFHQNGDRLTLAQIMRTELACEYRKLISVLRQHGYAVECELNSKNPSKNLYVLTMPVKHEETGQQVLL